MIFLGEMDGRGQLFAIEDSDKILNQDLEEFDEYKGVPTQGFEWLLLQQGETK